MDAEQHLIVVIVCISLITNDTEHTFMCLLGINIFYFVKYIFMFFTHFKVGLFVFLLICISLYLLDIGPLSDIHIIKAFPNLWFVFLFSKCCLFMSRIWIHAFYFLQLHLLLIEMQLELF